jgi:hypothetical protein
MDKWLVRTSKNRVEGPYTREQIRQSIQEGNLSFEDEVCAAEGYWFSLHEREEVLKYLDIDVPRNRESTDDEITQTQTQTEEILELRQESSPDSQENRDFPENKHSFSTTSSSSYSGYSGNEKGLKVEVSGQPLQSQPSILSLLFWFTLMGIGLVAFIYLFKR